MQRFAALTFAALSACVPDSSSTRDRTGGNSGGATRRDASIRIDGGQINTSADSGVREESDSGAEPPADSGTANPPRDSGFPPPIDAGFADSGAPNPPVDSGVQDSGTVTPPADSGVPTSGVAILGNGQHAISSVNLEVVADTAVGHNHPTDLAFHPTRANELWVTNQGDNSMWIATNAGTPQQQGTWKQNRNGGGDHFYAKPAALAFGSGGFFATAQDTNEITQSSTPRDFMGPTLWTSNLSIYDAGHRGHYDMLHNSPSGKGIAWESANIYWYFDGGHSAITKYDFRQDHGPGGEDHSDGITVRYVEGQVRMAADCPSHLELDRSTGLLYIADTGNNRIGVLDTRTGSRGRTISPNYDGTQQYRMDGAMVTTLVSGMTAGMQKPSGLEIHEGTIFVSDNGNSKIFAFNLAGQLLDYLETGLPAGSLAGMAFDAMGRLYLVDMAGNRVLKISPR